MKATRIVTICLAFVLVAPTAAFSAAATCDDFANCFASPDNPCELGDMYLGITLGAVDGIGELLCFVGDPKCSCFQAITDESNPGNDFDEWSALLQAGIDACAGTGAGGRSLNGVAFEAATNHCTPTFADIEPILTASCGTCHIQGMSGNFSMANGRDSIVNVPSNQSNLPYVTPGDPSMSYLFRKVEGTHMAVGSGSVMPLGGMLPPADIAAISAWIAGGAQ